MSLRRKHQTRRRRVRGECVDDAEFGELVVDVGGRFMPHRFGADVALMAERRSVWCGGGSCGGRHLEGDAWS